MTDLQKLELHAVGLEVQPSLLLMNTSEDWDEELALECELQDSHILFSNWSRSK